MTESPSSEGGVEFADCVAEALASVPDELRRFMSNVELVVEGEPPPGTRLLGLYQGPLERLYGGDRARLRSEIRRVVLHEIAHHFGISDARLRELDRY